MYITTVVKSMEGIQITMYGTVGSVLVISGNTLVLCGF
jgi:hypothetical protein